MKTWIALFLAVAMALSLCACGGDKTTPDSTAPGESTPNSSAPDNSKPDDEQKDQNVTVSLLTEITVTEKNADTSTDTIKVTLEYDEDYNIIGAKNYFNGMLSMSTTYNKDVNKPLLEQEYDENGQKTYRQEFTYDTNGNRLTNYAYDAEGNIRWGYENTYNADGSVLTEKCFDSGNLVSEFLYTYDTDGKLEYQVAIWEDGSQDWSRFTYDEHGNKLTETTGCDDNLLYENTYENTYENGKLVEVKAYQDGDLSNHTRYDADGHVVLSVSYYAGSEISREENVYENGRLIRSTAHSGTEETYHLEDTYDAAGRLIERRVKYFATEEETQTYLYNDAGILIGMNSREGDTQISQHTITYESVTVSKALAEKIENIIHTLGII